MKQISDQKIIENGVRKIRMAKRILLSLFIGFIPFAIIFSYIAEIIKINPLFFIGAYFIFVMILGSYFGLTSMCPRCNELYYWRKSGIGYRNIFTKKCLNCGLELNGMWKGEKSHRLG